MAVEVDGYFPQPYPLKGTRAAKSKTTALIRRRQPAKRKTKTQK